MLNQLPSVTFVGVAEIPSITLHENLMRMSDPHSRNFDNPKNRIKWFR